MKILIIGTVGTGKTTLAKKLSRQYNVKYYEIDSIVHDDEKNGRKRTTEEQNAIINTINKNENWIIEGVLRHNLEYLLDYADKIIYLDIPKSKRNRRIFTRFIKQKLGLEKANYEVNIKILKNMYQWSKDYETKRGQFESLLSKYKNKLEITKK